MEVLNLGNSIGVLLWVQFYKDISMVSITYWSKLWQAFKDPSFCILIKIYFVPLYLSFIFLCTKFFDDVLNDMVVEERKVVFEDQENFWNCVCSFQSWKQHWNTGTCGSLNTGSNAPRVITCDTSSSSGTHRLLNDLIVADTSSWKHIIIIIFWVSKWSLPLSSCCCSWISPLRSSLLKGWVLDSLSLWSRKMCTCHTHTQMVPSETPHLEGYCYCYCVLLHKE